MAAGSSKKEEMAQEVKPLNVKFTCQICGKDRPLADMRSITRFKPVMIVCRSCERDMH